jgi:hypothetical protein
MNGLEPRVGDRIMAINSWSTAGQPGDVIRRQLDALQAHGGTLVVQTTPQSTQTSNGMGGTANGGAGPAMYHYGT